MTGGNGGGEGGDGVEGWNAPVFFFGLKKNLTVETTVKFGHFGNLRLDRSRLCVDILQIKIVIDVLLVLLGRTGTALLSCKGLLLERNGPEIPPALRIRHFFPNTK